MRPGFAQTRFPAQALPVFAAMAIRSAVLFFIRFHFTAMAIRSAVLFFIRFHFAALAIRIVTLFFHRFDSKRLAKYKKKQPDRDAFFRIRRFLPSTGDGQGRLR